MPHLDGDLVLQHGPEVLDVLLLVLQPRHHLALLVQPSLLTRPSGEKYLGSSCVIRIKIFESHQQYLYLPIYLTTDRRQRPSWEFDKMVRGGWTGAVLRRWRPQQPFIGTTIDDNVQTFYTGVLLMNGRQKDDVKLFCKPKDVNSCVKQM